MKMVFRWFGEGNDTVTLNQIKQIPGVEGIVWALHDQPVVRRMAGGPIRGRFYRTLF